MSTPTVASRLRPIAATHPAAHRYQLARRNLLPRDERVLAVSGLWAHQQVLRLDGRVETFLWCPGLRPDAAVMAVAGDVARVAQASYEISERVLTRLQPGAHAPGLLSLVAIPTWDASVVLQRRGVLLVADGIEYAGNLGALLRTVDASGAGGLLITNPVARLTNPSVFSASRGTVLTTPSLEFDSVEEAQRALTFGGYGIVVADPESATDYRDLEYTSVRTAIVVGSEGAGVCAAWRTADLARMAISMRGHADSLNVATAAAILLFDRTGR